MVKNILTILVLFIAAQSFGQEKTFDVVEEQPEFKGGTSNLYKYLSDNIKYPKKCRKKEITGKVYVQFVIDKDGSVTDVKTLRSPHKLLTKEAERVVKKMPKWTPGEHKGKPVKVRNTLPIHFDLTDPED